MHSGQTPVRPVAVHLKEAFKQELDKMLQVGYIKPMHEATPWINSFVIVEGKYKQGKLKIRICLYPTNLNVAVISEPWFSKTPDDIAHMLADAVIITTTDCTKGFWHEALALVFLPYNIWHRVWEISIYCNALWYQCGW